LIKSLLASVFSEEAGRSMGKAAAAYYKELKDSGMPENIAVKMTEDYMKTFTSLGGMLQNISRSGRHGQKPGEKSEEALGEEIERRIYEKLKEKPRARDEEEDEEAKK
jgi:hypothetical protein